MKDYILTLFRANPDDLRPPLSFSSLVGTHVHSTNGHAIISIPAESLRLKYEAVEKFPNTAKFFNPDLKEAKIFQLSDIAIAISKMRGYWEMQQCEDCEGKGIKECECCGNEADCKSCQGSGKGRDEMYLSQQYFYYTTDKLKMGDYHFNPTLVNKLLIAASMLKCDAVLMHRNLAENSFGLIFRFDDVQVVLMPLLQPSFDIGMESIEVPFTVLSGD